MVDGCPCCTSIKDNDDLHAAPLRELTGDQLFYYGFSAVFTWGTVEDFKHFLPRLFELTATDGFDPPGTETLYHRLAYARFDTWPPAEQEAVRVFARAHLQSALTDDDGDDPEAVLTGVMLLGEDLTPYLEIMAADPDAADLLRMRYATGFRNAYLTDETRPAERRLRGWLGVPDPA